jgi:hypothetical protein
MNIIGGEIGVRQCLMMLVMSLMNKLVLLLYIENFYARGVSCLHRKFVCLPAQQICVRALIGTQ